MSSNASQQSHERPGTDGEERPARRQRIVEEDFGEPDIILLSDDNVEYPAHRAVLSTTCRLFSDMFEVANSDAANDELPRVPLLADSQTIEMVLPLAYRTSAANLRTKSFEELQNSIRLAHRLGMPLVVDTLAIYLEAHVKEHGLELYMLARQLGLDAIEALCESAAEEAHELALPNQYVGELGQQEVDKFHASKIARLLKFASYAQQSSTALRSLVKGCTGANELHFRMHTQAMLALTMFLVTSNTTLVHLFLSIKGDTSPFDMKAWEAKVRSLARYCHDVLEQGMLDLITCPVFQQIARELQDGEVEFRLALGLAGEAVHTADLSKMTGR